MTFFGNFNPYEVHKKLINDYILKQPGDTNLLQRDMARDRYDSDVIRENHRFLWDGDTANTWEQQLAKRYYDKLFKEYCIADLSRYQENKIALRWRVEKEVVLGKGQFICGNKVCTENLELRSWEVNFAYAENGIRKNALIKVRLCPFCSKKLNYHSKKREVKKFQKLLKKHRKLKNPQYEDVGAGTSLSKPKKIECSKPNMDTKNCKSLDIGKKEVSIENHEAQQKLEEDCWTKSITYTEEKSREEEFDEYLEELLL